MPRSVPGCPVEVPSFSCDIRKKLSLLSCAHEINPGAAAIANQGEGLQQPDMVLMLPGHDG